MITEIIFKHIFMSSILLIGAVSIFLQWIMVLSLKGYVKASANMKTTKKKIMINLKNQFETIYGMDYQVRNIAAYVDKYLLKLRFMGLSFSGWEKVPALTAGIVTLVAAGEAFYNYSVQAPIGLYVEIAFAYGVVLACLFMFFHIFGIKSKKQQIQIQLVDYLENYLTNRLIRTKEGMEELKVLDETMEAAFMEGAARNRELKDVILEEERRVQQSVQNREEDMDMLKNLLHEMGNRGDLEETHQEIAVSEEQALEENYKPEYSEESEIDLLEEFVQSFLA